MFQNNTNDYENNLENFHGIKKRMSGPAFPSH